MTGHELIKFYDGLMNLEAVHQYMNTVKHGPNAHEAWTYLLKEEIDPILLDYMANFPPLTKNWTFDLGEPTFGIISDSVFGPHNTNQLTENKDVLLSLAIFLDKGREVSFLRQGIDISSLPGRVVAFPAQWTHTFTMAGSGAVLMLNFRKSEVPWSKSDRVKNKELGLVTI